MIMLVKKWLCSYVNNLRGLGFFMFGIILLGVFFLVILGFLVGFIVCYSLVIFSLMLIVVKMGSNFDFENSFYVFFICVFGEKYVL